MRNRACLAAVMLSITTAGCASFAGDKSGGATPAMPRASRAEAGYAEGSPRADGGERALADSAAPRPAAFQQPAVAPAPEALARKVVYTADLKVVVTTIEPALLKARQLAEAAGGYLQNQTKNSITLRVPSEKFRELLEQVEGLGSVADRQVKAEDVTDQFIDLEARLRNAKNVEARLRDLLAKAKDVKEALEVERELKRLGEEIERFEGRLQYLKKLIAFSTVTVEFSTKATVPTDLEPLIRLPFGWIKELELKHLIEGGPRYRWE
jgi:hypothetical protein